MAAAPIIRMLDRVLDAYNLDRVAQVAAQAAFEDVEHFEAQRQKVMATREAPRAQLDAHDWFTYPSAANFLFTEPKNAAGESGPEVAASLFEYLKSQRVLVRYFSSHPLTCSFIRVSVGTDAEMKVFLTAVESWLNNA